MDPSSSSVAYRSKLWVLCVGSIEVAVPPKCDALRVALKLSELGAWWARLLMGSALDITMHIVGSRRVIYRHMLGDFRGGGA